MANKVSGTELRTVLRIAKAARLGSPLPTSQEARFGEVFRQLASLNWDDSVLGFGIGEKVSDYVPTGATCLRIYVRRKVHKSRLKGQGVVPAEFSVRTGKKSWTVPLDVVEMPKLPRAQKNLEPGDNIGHFRGTSGTVGVRVTGSTGKHFILTCSHVAAPRGAASGNEIESPADADAAPGPNVIGKLFSFTDLMPTTTHEVDAALVEMESPHTVNNDRLRLSAPPRFSSLAPTNFNSFQNRVVERFSRRVVPGGQERVVVCPGIVRSIENDLSFDLGFAIRRFEGVVEVAYTEPTAGGDSGSPVVDATARDVLGIHFAGLGNRGFFIMGSKIAQVLQVSVI